MCKPSLLHFEYAKFMESNNVTNHWKILKFFYNFRKI